MKKIMVMLVTSFAFLSASIVYADCPDRTHYCENTGTTITYGTCWKRWKGCVPCGDYVQQCNDTLFDRWMSTDSKIQQSSLGEITIPGAHDAGMGKVTACSDYAGPKVTQTQNKSMLQMLNSGTRYFDVRPVINHDGQMYLGHYTYVNKDVDLKFHVYTLRNEGCVGYTVDQMLDDVRNFVTNNSPANKEVIVLKFSHFANYKKYDTDSSHFDQDDFKELEAKITAKLKDFMVYGNKGFTKTPIKDLTRSGAKVIVTIDADGYDGSKGIYSQSILNLYDGYTGTSDFNRMKSDQLQKMDANAASSYFVLSWTLTQDEKQAIGCMIPENMGKPFGYDCKTIEDLASYANARLNDVLDFGVKAKKFPNILYVDFVSDITTKTAINLNRAR